MSISGALSFSCYLSGDYQRGAAVARDLPAPNELRQRASTFQTTRIYDREGNLLSRFPESTGGETGKSLQLPFVRAVVVDAALVIHQEGKPVFTIRGAGLATTVDQSIQIRAEITDVLGTQLYIESQVDQSTLGGRTRVSLSPVHLDSNQLARLPLVPNNLADHPVMGTLEADLQIEHAANDFDPRRHVVAFHARVADIVSQQYGPITNGIDLRAFQRDGRSTLTVHGPFANGELQLDAHLNLAQQVPQIMQ